MFDNLKRKIKIYIIVKGIENTLEHHKNSINGSLGLSLINLQNNFINIKNITQDFKDNIISQKYNIYINTETSEYFLVKNNIVCFNGNYNKTDKDKELRLDIIPYDYLHYNEWITLLTLVCLKKEEAKEYLDEHYENIFNTLFLEDELSKGVCICINKNKQVRK